MKFHCDRCDAQYMISDEKVGANGVKVRCKKCGNVIVVKRAAEVNGASAPQAPAPAAPPAAPAPGAEGGLDVDLGNAFDHAFGDTPAKGSPAPGGDLDATQAVGAEEAARLAAASAASPSPAPAATEWYVAIGQAQVGPLPLAEVKRKWEGGDVGPDSLVWRPGMGDWAPVSTVSDLSAYLAPVPQAPRRGPEVTPTAPVAPRGEPAAAATATPAPAAEVSWKPVAASALAALASEEIATRAGEAKPAAAAARPAPAGGRSLMDQLPEGGGVDPTGAIPLPIKALEKTDEKKLERRSSVARGAEELRQKRSANRTVLAVVAVVALGAAGAGGWLATRKGESRPPEPVAAAQPAPAAAPQPPPPAPAPAPAPAVAQAPAPAPEPAAAAPAPAEPAPVPSAEKAAPPAQKEPARVAQAEPPARHPKKEPGRQVARAAAPVAAAAPPPAAPPAPAPAAKKKKDSLLDFDSSDAALDEALGAQKPGRSVYVPPAPGGGALPATVSDSQVNETILSRVPALQQCVQEQKARDPEASGVLKMHWTISPDGSVRDVKCLTSEYASSPIAQCLSGVLRATRFPRSQGGRPDVTFPLKF